MRARYRSAVDPSELQCKCEREGPAEDPAWGPARGSGFQLIVPPSGCSSGGGSHLEDSQHGGVAAGAAVLEGGREAGRETTKKRVGQQRWIRLCYAMLCYVCTTKYIIWVGRDVYGLF